MNNHKNHENRECDFWNPGFTWGIIGFSERDAKLEHENIEKAQTLSKLQQSARLFAQRIQVYYCAGLITRIPKK